MYHLCLFYFQENELLKFLQEAVKETFNGCKNFPYAYDVLLPEVYSSR